VELLDPKYLIKMFLTHGSLINEINGSSCGFDVFNFSKDTFVLCDGANSCENGGILASLLANRLVEKWPKFSTKSNRINLIHNVILEEHSKFLDKKIEAASTIVGLKTITSGFEMISIGDSYGEIFFKDRNSWSKIYSMPRDLDQKGNPWQLVGSEVFEKIHYKKFDKTGSYCVFLLSDGAGNFLSQKSFNQITKLIGNNKPNSYDLDFFSADLVLQAKKNKSHDDISVAILYLDF